MKNDERPALSRAVAVEGRDDVTAVSRAVDALIIPTHGFGIASETWSVLQKAYEEKGLIILTDPDHAGEQIRKRLNERFPGSLNAYVARDDAFKNGDIGVENAEPRAIREALLKALGRKNKAVPAEAAEEKEWASMRDLTELGLSGTDGASARRAGVCRRLGIGYGNAASMLKKLRGFGIDIYELREAVKAIE